MKNGHKRRKLRPSDEESNEWIRKEIEEMTSYHPGELLSCDDCGPVNPASMGRHSRFFLFRETRSRRMHFFAIKINDSATFLKCLECVSDYYKAHGFKAKMLRTDYFKTALAEEVQEYQRKNNIN